MKRLSQRRETFPFTKTLRFSVNKNRGSRSIVSATLVQRFFLAAYDKSYIIFLIQRTNIKDMYNQLSNQRRQVSNKCPLFGKSTLLLFFWSIRNSWLLLAIKKPSEALAGNLQTNKIHIYTIPSTLLCRWKTWGAGHGLQISVTYTLRGPQKSIEWVKKAVECGIKVTNDMKKKCLK